MTKRTRYFMAGSAAILLAGLCTGLVAFYGGGFQALSASTGPTELQFVPADAAVVAYADVRGIMDSELRIRLKQVMPLQEHGQEEFQRHTGINIETDIDYVVASLSAPTNNVQHMPEGALVVARGRFNTTQLESLAREHGGAVEEYRGKRLITSTRERSSPTLAFLEPGLVAVGASAAVKKAIDAAASATSITSNNEMMELVSDIERSNNAWAVGRFDLIASQAKLPEQISRQLPPVKWFAAAGHINGGVAGTLRVEARDEEAAELLRRQVNGALAFGEMMARSDPRAAAIISSLQMSGRGKTVQVSFTVPSALLDLIKPHQLQDMHKEHLQQLHKK